MAGATRLPSFFLWGKFQAAWTPPVTMNLGVKKLCFRGAFWGDVLWFYTKLLFPDIF
jgi:hypothetical protein